MLIKMAAFNGKGKKAFNKVVSMLFTNHDERDYSTVIVNIKQTTRQPNINILKRNDGSQLQFVVYFDQNVIPLPEGSSFINALDVLFKVSFIFSVSSGESLSSLFDILETLVYELKDESSLGLAQRKLFDMLKTIPIDE